MTDMVPHTPAWVGSAHAVHTGRGGQNGLKANGWGYGTPFVVV